MPAVVPVPTSGLVCDLEIFAEVIGKFWHRDLHEPKRPRGREKQGVKLSSLGHGGTEERFLKRVSRLSHRQRVGLICASVSFSVQWR